MKKALLIGLALLALILWGDVLLDFLLTTLQLGLEVLELVVEDLLEALLALTGHEAQLVTAWLGFGLAVLLSLFGWKKVTVWWRAFRIRQTEWWAIQKSRLPALPSVRGWPLAVVVLLALLILLASF